jgi:hypothetical protein
MVLVRKRPGGAFVTVRVAAGIAAGVLTLQLKVFDGLSKPTIRERAAAINPIVVRRNPLKPMLTRFLIDGGKNYSGPRQRTHIACKRLSPARAGG